MQAGFAVRRDKDVSGIIGILGFRAAPRAHERLPSIGIFHLAVRAGAPGAKWDTKIKKEREKNITSDGDNDALEVPNFFPHRHISPILRMIIKN